MHLLFTWPGADSSSVLSEFTNSCVYLAARGATPALFSSVGAALLAGETAKTPGLFPLQRQHWE